MLTFFPTSLSVPPSLSFSSLRLNQAPGGIGEIFLDGESGKEFALIKGHKGFVRTAMARGVPLVPVYGEQALLFVSGFALCSGADLTCWRMARPVSWHEHQCHVGVSEVGLNFGEIGLRCDGMLHVPCFFAFFFS